MQTVLTCPSTEEDIVFELPTDDASLTRMWHEAVHIECPCCSGLHQTAYRDVYVVGTMGQFQCLPADVKEARVH